MFQASVINTTDPLRQLESARLQLNQLLSHRNQPIHTLFQQLTAITSQALHVQRAGIWLLSPDRSLIRSSCVYDSLIHSYTSGDELSAAEHPKYFQALLRRRRVIHAESAQDNSLTSDLSDTYLKPLGIASMLDSPIYLKGEIVGVVCHEHTGQPREWTMEERDFVSSVADITAIIMMSTEMQLLETLNHSSDLLIRNQMNSFNQLVAGIGHDIRNILTVVLGASSMLSRKLSGSIEARTLMNQITSSIEQGTRLADELMDFGKSTSDESTPRPMDAMVERICGKLSLMLGDKYQLQLTGSTKLSLPISEVLIERVLTNLMINSRDAMPGGGKIMVELSTQLQINNESNHAVRYARINVSDYGQGISSSDLPYIFDPYFTTKKQHGTGLGLSVVKQIVERAGGYIAVRSQIDEGTTFSVFLPVEK